MSFRRFLRDNRSAFIDHRDPPPPLPKPSIEECFADDPTFLANGRPGKHYRNRKLRSSARFKHMRPAFAPSAFSDPLPYEEPWQRAFR